MKTNQSLTITVENGHAVFTTSDGKSKQYTVPPFPSFFRTIYTLLEKEYSDITYAQRQCDEPNVTIHYNGVSYRWNNFFARYAFEKEGMTEESFADNILVESEGKEA